MSNALVTLGGSLAKRFGMPDSPEVLTILKHTAFKGQVSDAQMTALLVVANQYGLNPWTKEIYAFPDKNNGIVPVVGVDGWSRIINEHPQFDGLDFEQTDEECTCRMYRKDRSHAIAVTEYMSECRRDNALPWKTHPKRMLRHKAMIQCARLAFGFVGIYDEDEAQRINEPPRNMGAAEVVEPPSELLDAAKASALRGMDAYREFFQGTTAENRVLLSAYHEALKREAKHADEQRQPDVQDAEVIPYAEGVA